MTIVTIRGTSGSGKSTLARRIMELYPHKEPIYVPRRQKPLYYNYHRDENGDGTVGRPLQVLGHYETATGGGDTISDGLDFIAHLAKEGHDNGKDVLYEGLVISSDFKRIVDFHNKGIPTLIVVLNTPLQECLDSVQARRAAKGNLDPLNPKATTEKHRAVEAMVPRFRAAGVDVHHVNREEGFQLVRERLGL
jgi:energy-coupling factor transporter ATP-binding protein EcfA2